MFRERRNRPTRSVRRFNDIARTDMGKNGYYLIKNVERIATSAASFYVART